jgi:hypothetical protein
MIVIARKYGQLGNRLALFARLIAASRDLGVPVINLAFFDYARYFRSTCDDLFCRYPPKPSIPTRWTWARLPFYAAVYVPTRLQLHLGWLERPLKVLRVDHPDDLKLDGEEFARMVRDGRPLFVQGFGFSNVTGCKRHVEAIRDYFRPVDAHEKAVDEVVSRARNEGEVLVGVHIRRGDYANYRGGEYFFPDARYREWMLQMERSLAPRTVVFVVCSNDAVDPATFEGLRVIRGPGHLVEDMYAFARCDYLIGPPSSYTIWASYYGDVPVQYVHGSDSRIDLDRFQIFSGL